MTKPKIHPTKGQGNAKPPSKAGRKSAITDKQIAVFVAAIENGFKVKEALVQAEMKKDAYYRKLKSSQSFRDQVDVAEMKMTMKARSNIATAISNGDVNVSKWWLERKVPEEFRPQFGDDGNSGGLPPGTVIVLPGSKPHPRIVPEGQTK